MTNEYQKETFSEYYLPSQSPLEKMIGAKISRMFKGASAWLIPLSCKYGDDVTAVAINCTTYSTSLIELSEPFKAFIEDFDGQFLKIRTDHYYCLKVDLGDLKDIFPCSNEISRKTGS